MTLDHVNGFIRFKISKHEALSKWAQKAIQNAMNSTEAPPEELRFSCRIATDARKNFERIELPDGETLALHPSARPQFGKNHKGHAYLTATLVYSGDGQSYTFRWVADAVPLKMQEIAVKHDAGKGAPATTVRLDLGKAQIAPAWKANRHGGRTKEDARVEASRRRKRNREEGHVPKPRNCPRLTAADV